MSAPMARVLIVSSLQVHPTLSGGNLRTYALANALLRRGAEVSVYSFVGRKKEYLARAGSATQTWPSGVQEHVVRSWASFLFGYGSYMLGLPPLWLTAFLRMVCGGWLGDLLLPRGLRERLAWCDTVVADFPFMHPVFAARAAQGKLRVLNTHNIEHHLYRTDGTWRERTLRRLVQRVELEAAAQADVVVGCSPNDKAYFEAHATCRRAIVVPNGVDVDRFQAAPGVREQARADLGIADDVLLVLFTASRWGPNQEAFEFLHGFARANEQALLEHRIHLLVVGGVVDSPVHAPAFTATGKVAAVEPYFAAADAGINPLVSGAGTNVKMGEFIAARLPVLVTDFGARGYRIDDGRSGIVFDRATLMESLLRVQRLHAEAPDRLAAMADEAFRDNGPAIDMTQAVLPLVELIGQRSALPRQANQPGPWPGADSSPV